MKWLGGLLVAVIVVIGLMTVLGQGPAVPALGLDPSSTADSTQTGYAAVDARLVQTGDDGTPLYLLEAKRMRQDSASEDVLADDVRLNYVPPEAPADQKRAWTLTADQGRMPGDSKQIALTGKVRLAGHPEGAKDPVRLETSALDFDVESQVASSKQAVSFYFGARRLTARGLNADLKQGTLRLESSVHGRFPP
ncbi:MAG: LPS export ABC transporter periplasmic protein LptC [Steroidobacteraceae bacterium]